MNAQRATAVYVCLLALIVPATAQQRVDPRNMYERLMMIVPIIGTGTLADPKRPMYAPAPHSVNPTSRTGILGFTHVMSDDGRFALVEVVARDKSAFQQILSDAKAPTSSIVAVFVKGVNKAADIQATFQKYRKDFDFSKFGLMVP